MRRGLALVLVVGVLAVLAVLGSAFAVLSRLERKAASQRVEGTQAGLAARSGIEDAAARLALGQDFAYGGEDLDGNGVLTAGIETAEQLYRPGVLDTALCPVAQALRPSFFVNDKTGPGAPPVLERVDGRLRALSGRLSARAAYALKAEDQNGSIFINGGALDRLDRDPDGPPATAADFPLNPGAAAEVGPLVKNNVEDHHDTSMEGPNGFLVRLLNNLDRVVTGSATLGNEIVGARPPGGYRSVADLKAVLTPGRYEQFRRHLTVSAWVDPKVLKPQPMDGRPRRFEDIDDTHRIGSNTGSVSGMSAALGASVQGMGTSDVPWTLGMETSNLIEGTVRYDLRWERGFVYAWRQLRLAPAGFEPRAPVSIHTATTEILASVFLGLKGTYLEVWDGTAGWDGGTGFRSWEPDSYYGYPSIATEDTPWWRTRLDYGMGYGTAQRPWYGPADYDPNATWAGGDHGKPLVWCGPLGRLRETPPISLLQAKAVAAEVRNRLALQGPFRSWAELNAFVDALPAWEDLDDDGVLDGASYAVSSLTSNYTRKPYLREDADSNGVLSRQVFSGGPAWSDPGQTRAALEGAGGPAPGLTFVQKDLLKAMANPNADLNDFNPDANLWKEVDKSDLAGIASAPSSYVHTAELALDPPGRFCVRSLGRSTAAGRLAGVRQERALLAFDPDRDTAQADFMREYAAGNPVASIFSGSAPYPFSGGQALVSYPEPQTAGGVRAADAAYDGQLGLGFVSTAAAAGAGGEFRGDFFDTLTDALVPDTAVPDLRGPFRERLVRLAGQAVGEVLPDGVYSEKDATLRFEWSVATDGAGWVKVNWFPEASPRAHALWSESTSYPLLANGCVRMGGWSAGSTPIDDIPVRPVGAYFAPGRNNELQGQFGNGGGGGVQGGSRGNAWPRRSLIFGNPHGYFASECVNRRGMDATRPVGRLQAHRWVHVVFTHGRISPQDPSASLYELLGGVSADPPGGGGWSWGISSDWFHSDGTVNHTRYGEMASLCNMNYLADATFANLRSGNISGFISSWRDVARYGRYVKETGPAFTSPKRPRRAGAVRATWTEIPCDPWFDTTGPPDDWADALLPDRNGNGRRDVRIDLEVWDDRGTAATADDACLGRFNAPGGGNLSLAPQGRVYYKAVFVNEWDSTVRLNNPLNVTPFLDDVTLMPSGASFLQWEGGADA